MSIEDRELSKIGESLCDNNKGWISLHRVLLEKPIWRDSTPQQKVILITLLMMANHKKREWEWEGKKYKAKPGELVTSLERIVLNSGKGVSIQNVRTAIKRFEKYGFLTNKSTNRNRLITIINWETYQLVEKNQQANQQVNKQETNKQLTSNNNENNSINKIYNLWNKNQVGIVHTKLPSEMAGAIDTKIKKYGFEEVKKAIGRLCKAVHDEDYYYNNKWNLRNFMQQKNGLPNWLDEGQIWNDYCHKRKVYKKVEVRTTKEARRKTIEYMKRNGIKC